MALFFFFFNLLWVWQIFRLSLFLMTQVLRSGVVENVLHWDLSDVFSWSDWGCVFWGGSPQSWSAICISSRLARIFPAWLIAVDVKFDHLADIMFARLPFYTLTFFPSFPHSALLAGSHFAQSRLKELQSYAPLPWGQNVYTDYLEFFVTGDLSRLPHLFIYSLIYLFQYALTNIYFILWGKIQYYPVYFVA